MSSIFNLMELIYSMYTQANLWQILFESCLIFVTNMECTNKVLVLFQSLYRTFLAANLTFILCWCKNLLSKTNTLLLQYGVFRKLYTTGMISVTDLFVCIFIFIWFYYCDNTQYYFHIHFQKKSLSTNISVE